MLLLFIETPVPVCTIPYMHLDKVVQKCNLLHMGLFISAMKNGSLCDCFYIICFNVAVCPSSIDRRFDDRISRRGCYFGEGGTSRQVLSLSFNIFSSRVFSTSIMTCISSYSINHSHLNHSYVCIYHFRSDVFHWHY